MNKTELCIVLGVFLFSLVICFAQFMGLEKVTVIDLSDERRISIRDDRVFSGVSIGQYKRVNQGWLVNCELAIKEFKWPFCELRINISQLKDGELNGLDLSKYERVGLWIDHDHDDLPGTRVEIHNFSSKYTNLLQPKKVLAKLTKNSVVELNDYLDVNTLKYNTLEFSEKNVPHPTWIDLNNFYIPTWWNDWNSPDLQTVGTDFSNIYSIAITTGGALQSGSYNFTLKRIEFRGKYIDNETLFFLLAIIWSLVAGFFLRKFSSTLNENKKLEQKKKAAEIATLAKTKFLANMSHEIRTPINTVVGMTYLASKTALTTQQSEYINKIQLASDSLQEVINDILTLSKIEAGALSVINKNFNLSELLKNCIDVMQNLADKKDLALSLTFPPSDLSVYTDKGKLRQILINLLSNAIKFTETGSVQLTCEVKQDNNNLQLFQFTVQDTGIGIKQDQIEQIFEAFNQINDDKENNPNGTGLGLPITRQLVSLLGGVLAVKSEIKCGSQFSFSIWIESKTSTYPVHSEKRSTLLTTKIKSSPLGC